MKHSVLPKLTVTLLVAQLLVSPISAQTVKQPPINYKLFDRSPLSTIQVQPPQPFQFQPVDITKSNSLITQPPIQPQQLFNTLSQNIHEQNQRVLQQHEAISNGGSQRDAILEDIRNDVREVQLGHEYREWLAKTKYYREAYENLLQLNPDSFSITNAVYLVENAWYEGKYSFSSLKSRLQLEAKIIKQQLRNEKVNLDNTLALNYGIQKRFKTGGQYYDPKKKQTLSIKPFKYDFEDYKGEKDYSKMFTLKMLITGKGQCHSMPLLYLMIAEELGTKAWLSLAPEHSFIRFMDAKSNLLNFETTNSNLVSTTWLHQSGYINAAAIKNKIYLDTLSQRQLYAQCLADLLLGYLSKFQYDGFSETMRQKILQLNPQNMTALLLDAKLKTNMALHKINAAGRPLEKDLHNYPDAYQAYLLMHQSYDNVDGLGFQDMPAEAYQRWLKSVDQEKKKQENIELQQRIQREIKQQKQYVPKSTVIDRTRG